MPELHNNDAMSFMQMILKLSFPYIFYSQITYKLFPDPSLKK